MIDKREILDVAGRMSLQPGVVEKDYVLGWMLAGIFAHPELEQSWVFKGGTCLKKCFFETYRFSEDLDFTLMDESHLDAGFLKRVFGEIGRWVHDQAGIEVPADGQDFDLFANPRGSISCEGKLSYRGPVSPRSSPRIKLDLTADERLVLAPVRVAIFHPYSDVSADGMFARAYAYEAVFAEKTRALAERTRPRDLYDVINLFRNADARPSSAVMLDVLRQKCDHKGIRVPHFADLAPHRDALTGSWKNMLEHQLPSLPPVEDFWDALPEFFEWLLALLHRSCRPRSGVDLVKRSCASANFDCRSPPRVSRTSRLSGSPPPTTCWSRSTIATRRVHVRHAWSKRTRWRKPRRAT